MHRKISTPWVVAIVGVTLVIAFSVLYQMGKSGARQEAFKQIRLLQSNTLGADETRDAIAKLRQALQDGHGMKVEEVNVTEQQLVQYQADGWTRTALADKKALYDTHNDPQAAADLKTGFEYARKQSGRSYAQLGVNEQALAQQVARNGLEFAKRSGAPITNAMYRSAGIPVPVVTRTVVKTRTIRVAAKKKPVVKASQKKSVARRKISNIV